MVEHLRAGIEGTVYLTIAAKVDSVEATLADLDAHLEQVTRLTGWNWIVAALDYLPQEQAA